MGPADIGEIGATASTLLAFLNSAAAVLERPLPGPELFGSDASHSVAGEADEAERTPTAAPPPPRSAAAVTRAPVTTLSADGAETVQACAAQTLRRLHAYAERAHSTAPLLACVHRCARALRKRRQLRSREEQQADGTLEGVCAEVEALVSEEAARALDWGGVPTAVASHLMRQLQAQLQVPYVGDILPRIAELTRAARLALTIIEHLRGAFDLPPSASIESCLGAAQRSAHAKRTLDGISAHLCALVGVDSLEALIPAVRQLCLTHKGRAPPLAARAMLGGGAYDAYAAGAYSAAVLGK